MSAGRRLLKVADALPITVLAAIAGAGSFTHIRDTAAQHGQTGPMSWAVAVCIDLTCVMAARERQRDKKLGIPARRLSWPTVVLAGGVLLSLAANLAQAQPTAWGRIVAAVPPGAFLVAVSMIERRAARHPEPAQGQDGGAGEPSAPGRSSRCRLPGTRRRMAGTRRSSRRLGGPPPSTRTSTASPSPATRCAPASACPTRPPPNCCASSARARSARRELHAPPDLRPYRQRADGRRQVPARRATGGLGWLADGRADYRRWAGARPRLRRGRRRVSRKAPGTRRGTAVPCPS